MLFPVNKANALLLAGLSEDASQQVGEEELQQALLWETAVSHKVASAIAWNIAQQTGWDAIPDQWWQAYSKAETRIRAFLAELDRVVSLLAGHQNDVLILENGALAQAVFSELGVYTFGDFDCLVSDESLVQIHSLMPDGGYELVTKSDGRVEYYRLLEGIGELRFNFQTNLVARRWMYGCGEPDFETLLSRSIPVLDSPVRILGAEDFLYQLCIHNASHAYVRKPGIRLHLDIDWYLKKVTVDWSSFVDMVIYFDAATRVYFSLLIPKELFVTPVPDNVLVQLRPPAWKEKTITRMINSAGLFNPHEQKFTRWEYILFNILLYDDFSGLWRGIFPDRMWMVERYKITHVWQLPYYHVRRIKDLLLRRLNA